MHKPAKSGWFAIPGQQTGERTLDEQLMGLEPVLAACAGKTVLDLGCAEGLIGLECVRAGAAVVHGVDNNEAFVATAAELAAQTDGVMRVASANLNDGLPGWLLPRYDIVLALAILHKLGDPEAATRDIASRAGAAMVVRLPLGSVGVVHCKHQRTAMCDLRTLMPTLGFRLELVAKGPRRERVQHWRRT